MAQEAGLQVIEDKLMRFVNEELLDEGMVEGTDPLVTDAVDSLGLEQLIDFIEREFEVTIDDEEMTGGSFSSIPVLAALVESKRREVLG